MTILGTTTEEPLFCGCCGRAASSVAVRGQAGLLFLCVFCNHRSALKVAAMKPNELHDVEKGAVRLALLATPELCNALFKHLWDSNVRDLALAARDYDVIVSGFIESAGMAAALEKFLLNYTHNIRVELLNIKAGA